MSQNLSQKESEEELKKRFGGQIRPPYKLGKLHDYNGDISKRWTIEFWVWNQNLNNGLGDLQRKQKKLPLRLSAEERRQQAQEFIFEVNHMLIMGYHIKSEEELDPLERAEQAKKEITVLNAIEVVMSIKKAQLAELSYKDYRLEAKKLTEWIDDNFPDMLLAEFTEQHAINFLDYEQTEKGLSNRTRNNKLAVFKSLFGALQKKGFSEINAFADIDKEKQLKPQNYPFRAFHKKTLLPYMRENDRQHYNACLFQYYLFVRPGEIQNMKIEQIQWEQRQVVIPNTNKSKAPRYPTISEAFEKVIIEMGILELNPSWYVFGKDGEPGTQKLGNNTLRERFRDIRDHFGISGNYTFYCWKHTGNLDSLLAGVNIKAIQKQNGHADIATTDIYLRSLGFEHNQQIRERQPELDF